MLQISRLKPVSPEIQDHGQWPLFMLVPTYLFEKKKTNIIWANLHKVDEDNSRPRSGDFG
jgi:hypothetical protein